MIVISGALVLVALVLLVLGLTMQDLNFVYGSIAVSLVSFVFLVIGILQRRGDSPAPATAGPEVREDSAAAQESAPTQPVAVPVSRGSRRAAAPVVEQVPEEDDRYDDEDDDAELGGAVLVVPGRPRYHVDGCRYLTGRDADELDVLDARAEGFTPCGVCKPDAALAEEPEDMFVDAYDDEDGDEDDDVVDTGVPGVTEPEPEPEPEPAPASRSRGSRRVAEAAPAPAPRARKAPAKKAAGRKPAKKDAAVVPVQPAAVSTPAAVPAKAGRRAGRVVVIPDRGRFHTPDCRFVRGVEGTEDLTRTQATKQGYQACGVCKPA